VLKAILILICSYLINLLLGYVFVKTVLRRFRVGDSGLRRAGSVIGLLERFLTLTFVLVREYLAIGLILTAKSIDRFEELKDRRFSEYFLIGTLSSISFSIFVGIITSWILENLS